MDTRIQLDSLYQEIILDHHKDPRNFGGVEGAEAKAEGYNPLCGDRVEIELKRSSDDATILGQVAFKGEGCSICMASASMMCEATEKTPLEKTEETIDAFRSLMKGEEVSDFEDTDLEALSGVRKFPIRIKCALLPWTTLKEALENLNK